MSVSTAQIRRLEQKAAERLLEDERLRSNLTDEQAKTLLDWGLAQLSLKVSKLGPAALQSEDLAKAAVEDATQRIQKTMTAINDLVGERRDITVKELTFRLRQLVAPARLDQEIRRLARASGNLSDDEFLVQLTALVSQAWAPARAAVPAAPVTSLWDQPYLGLPFKAWLLRAVGLILAFILLAVMALAFLFQGWAPALAPSPTPVSPGADWYQVYFTTPIYPDDPAKRRPSLDERLTSFINSATKSVDMAIYQLDLPNVTQALLDAQKRGCTVRVVTDINILNDPKESASFKKLQAAGIKVVAGNPNAIMHNKFVVVDGTAVWMGSWNFTANDTYRYNNNAMLIRSPELAQNYTVTFEKMWRDNKFGPSRKPGGTKPILTIGGVTVENYFAPEDRVASKIIARLQKAQKSIYFMAYSFTDENISNVAIAKAKAGVKVRGIFERTGSETAFSAYPRMKAAGLEVLQDGNPYLMHHKVFIVDEATVILGSFNFSKNAEEENDENLIIVDDARLAKAFLEEFQRVYEKAQGPPSK